MDYIWVIFIAAEKRRPTFLFSNLRYFSLHMDQNVIYTAGKSFSVVTWP